MKLPNSAHFSRPWRIHDLTRDFRLEDVWALPTPGGPDDFPRLVQMVASFDGAQQRSSLVGMLFAIREALGQVFGWDGPAAADDPMRPSLRDRLPADLRDSESAVQPAMGFTPLYQSDDEWAAELINRTVQRCSPRLGAGRSRRLSWSDGDPGEAERLTRACIHGSHHTVSLSDRLPAHAERSWPKVAVVQRRSVVATEGSDYADAFAIPISAADTRSAEDLVRAGLGAVPRWLGAVVLMTHRHVLRLELAPGSSPNHLLGWEILAAEHDSIMLRATGPLLDGLLVVSRVPPSTAVLETFVSYRRPVLARIVWTAVAPIHCAVASYLLGRATTASAGR